jgi:hypothetical protein
LFPFGLFVPQGTSYFLKGFEICQAKVKVAISGFPNSFANISKNKFQLQLSSIQMPLESVNHFAEIISSFPVEFQIYLVFVLCNILFVIGLTFVWILIFV